MASINMRHTDVPREKYEPVPSNVGNGIPMSSLRDEEKGVQSKRIETVYHTAQSGMVYGSGDNYHFPTTFPSMWEWAAADAVDSDSHHGYKDVAASFVTEFIGATLFALVVNTVLSLYRGNIAPPFVSAPGFPYPVAIAAGLTYMFIHSTMWMFSVNIFPVLSLAEFLSPHSWKRYNRSGTGSRWPQAAAVLVAQWIAQFIGTLLGTWAAFEMEDDTFVPMNDFARAGRMIVYGATATQAGVQVALSFTIFAVAYFAMTLEGYRTSSAQTRSVYVGLAMVVAFFHGHVQSSTIFSWWQPISSSIVLAGAGLTSPWHIYNSDASCALPASCFSNTAYWCIVFLPVIASTAVAYLVWFFPLRLTSSNTNYAAATEATSPLLQKPYKSA